MRRGLINFHKRVKMCHTFLSKSSESEKKLNGQSLASPPKTQNLIQAVPLSPLELFKKQLVADLKKYDIALLNYVVKLDNAYLNVNATQKRFACEAGISRGHANHKSIPRLVERGYLFKQKRGRYDTCIYSLPALFKQPQLRALLSDILPAMRGVSTGYLLSNYLVEKSRSEKFNAIDNGNLITPIIKEGDLQYYKINKLPETRQKTNSSPPSNVDFQKKTITINQRIPQRTKKGFDLPVDSPWNIPYPWKTT